MVERVTVPDMMNAREARAQAQRMLLERHPGASVVCLCMNIAGPVKNSEEIAWGFQFGCRLLLRQLERVKAPLLYQESRSEVTGHEGYFVVDL